MALRLPCVGRTRQPPALRLVRRMLLTCCCPLEPEGIAQTLSRGRRFLEPLLPVWRLTVVAPKNKLLSSFCRMLVWLLRFPGKTLCPHLLGDDSAWALGPECSQPQGKGLSSVQSLHERILVVSWQQALQDKGCESKSQGTKEDRLPKRQAPAPRRDREAPEAGGTMNVEKPGKGGQPHCLTRSG